MRLISAHAPDAKASLSLGSGVGWLQPALNKILIATWVCRLDDAAAIATMDAQARRLADKISEEFAAQNIPAPRFIERTMQASSSLMQFEIPLRQLLLQTLLELETEESTLPQATMSINSTPHS